MFERWNKQARLSVVLAQHIAMDRGADYIHTGHILLGLRCLGDVVTTTALDEVGMPPIPKPPDPGIPKVHIPFNPEAKDALQHARDEAWAFGDGDHDQEVRPGHLLMAVIPTDAAAAELAKYGVDPERLRARVTQLLGR